MKRKNEFNWGTNELHGLARTNGIQIKACRWRASNDLGDKEWMESRWKRKMKG